MEKLIKINFLSYPKIADWGLAEFWERGRFERHSVLKDKLSMTSAQFFSFFFLIIAKWMSLDGIIVLIQPLCNQRKLFGK